MLFAELSATEWVMIIGAIFLGIGQLVTLVLNHLANKAKVERDALVAKKLEVAATQARAKSTELDQKIDGVAVQVGAVQKATNGMRDQLVREVREASFAAGAKSETDKN